MNTTHQTREADLGGTLPSPSSAHLTKAFHCRRTLNRNRVKRTIVISEAKARLYQPDGLDCFVDLVHMRLRVRRTDGHAYEPDKGLIGIKGHPLCVLQKVMRCPGVFWRVREIAQMPPYHDSHFINENIVQYVARLRRNLFCEDKNHERFLLTLRDPYREAFNGELSFCLIEPAAELTEQTSRSE